MPPAPIRPNSLLAPRTGNSSAVTSQKPEVSNRAPRATSAPCRTRGASDWAAFAVQLADSGYAALAGLALLGSAGIHPAAWIAFCGVILVALVTGDRVRTLLASGASSKHW